jgi:hypothetical protein
MVRELKSNPVPKGLFKKTLAEIEKEKEDRRKQITDQTKQQYDAGLKKRFDLTTEKRPNKFNKIKEEVLKEQEKEL